MPTDLCSLFWNADAVDSLLSQKTRSRMRVVQMLLQPNHRNLLSLGILPVDLLLDRILPQVAAAVLWEERVPMPLDLARLRLEHFLTPSTTYDRGCRIVNVDGELRMRLITPSLGDMQPGPNCRTMVCMRDANNTRHPFVASADVLYAETYGKEYLQSDVGSLFRRRFQRGMIRTMDTMAARHGLQLVQYDDEVPRKSTCKVADVLKYVSVFALETHTDSAKVFMWIDVHSDALDAVLLREDQWAEDPDTTDAVVEADWNPHHWNVFHPEITWAHSISDRNETNHHAHVDSEVHAWYDMCLWHTQRVCSLLALTSS